MGLLVRDHLQAVFGPPQEQISRFQLAPRLVTDPLPFGKRGERRQRAAVAQFRMTAARDQLLGLDEEFDLADAAAPELDVVAGDRDLAMAAIGVDLPLHRMDVGERGEIHVFAPHEGRQRLQQLLARRDVAGAGPRLDHRRAFPVLAAMLVIIERRPAPRSRSGWRPDRAAAAGRRGTHSRRRCAPAAASPDRG